MAELELSEKELEKLKKDYSGMGEIKAPSDGIILEVNIDKGNDDRTESNSFCCRKG